MNFLSSDESIQRTLRTLSSLDTWYRLFSENGFNKKEMKNNNPRILYLCDNPDTILENRIPPPELLLIGFVKSLGLLLLDAWPRFDQ